MLVLITHNLYGALGYIGGFLLAYIVMLYSIYFSIKAKKKEIIYKKYIKMTYRTKMYVLILL